jgi:hypothetical protein
MANMRNEEIREITDRKVWKNALLFLKKYYN